jgi:hypothetical protein
MQGIKVKSKLINHLITLHDRKLNNEQNNLLIYGRLKILQISQIRKFCHKKFTKTLFLMPKSH